MFLKKIKQFNRNNINNKKGFTIIELLVVISIIGLLSTISVVSLNGARIKSRDAKRVSDVDNIKKAIELYYDDKGEYPVALSPISLGTTNTLVLCDGGFKATSSSSDCPLGKIYMGKIPRNPTPNGIEYTYTSITSSDNYNLAYSLEQGTASLPSGYNVFGDGEDTLSYGLIAYYPLNGASEILGNELVTNGDFSSSTGWTVPANWTISGNVAHIQQALLINH